MELSHKIVFTLQIPDKNKKRWYQPNTKWIELSRCDDYYAAYEMRKAIQDDRGSKSEGIRIVPVNITILETYYEYEYDLIYQGSDLKCSKRLFDFFNKTIECDKIQN